MNERKQQKRAFSLIEIMIALGIMSILLGVILLPLRLGFDSLHVGQARSSNQSAVQATLSDIENDLRQSAYVFPNAELPGVTDKTPFIVPPTSPSVTPTPLPPYTRSTSLADTDVPTNTGCGASSGYVRWSDASRIDMIPAKRSANGSIVLPVELGDTIVTYYASRLSPLSTYDPIDNPIVLKRAEYRWRDPNNPATQYIKIDSNRFDTSACSGSSPNNFNWLAHNVYGESVIANTTASPNIFNTLTLTVATPRGIGLVASRAYRVGNGFTTGTITKDTEAPFKPDSSFTCLDTNDDGKIDRVNISLAVANFDTSSNSSLRNGQPSGQSLRAERTITLPNIQ